MINNLHYQINKQKLEICYLIKHVKCTSWWSCADIWQDYFTWSLSSVFLMTFDSFLFFVVKMVQQHKWHLKWHLVPQQLQMGNTIWQCTYWSSYKVAVTTGYILITLPVLLLWKISYTLHVQKVNVHSLTLFITSGLRE